MNSAFNSILNWLRGQQNRLISEDHARESLFVKREKIEDAATHRIDLNPRFELVNRDKDIVAA